jgi:ribose transport system substrate-binding protein
MEALKKSLKINGLVSVLILVLLVANVLVTGNLLQEVRALPVIMGEIAARPVVVEAAPVEAAPPTVAELQNGVPFRYIGNGLSHPVIRIMMLGFQEACDDNGALCEFNVGDGFEDSTYISMLDQATAQGATGMLISAYGPHRPAAQPAIDQGIPLVSFHTPLAEGDFPGLLAWVATDVTLYGQDAAEAMAEKLECAGPIAITQNTFNDVENEASRSFTERMNELCPDVEVLAPEIEGGDAPAAIAKAGAILTAHPDIAGAFGTTGGSPTTWGKALEQAGRNPGDVIVIGMDYTMQNLDLVKAGWVYALVGQPIYEETYRCVELLVANLKGEPVDFANVYPSPIITIDDVDKYYGYADRVDAALQP